jgi:predicted ATPase/class 3 adenylate cyclase
MSKKQSTLINPDQLATSFVPAILKWQYANDPDRKTGDPLKEDHATLLWIDVCNFSPLCNRLMKDTVSGVEKLTDILQSHYDFVLNTIAGYGGQPLFFAGDGLMSAWPGDKKKARESVQLAAACAYKIINKRNTLDDNKELLSIHALVSTGPWQMVELEGIHGNCLVNFFGDVFNDLTLASKNKAPNQVLISNAALAFVDEGLRSKPVEYATSILLDAPTKFEIPELSNPYLTEGAIQKLQSFAPLTLAFPLNRERLKWIAEIRPVTILFVRLPNSSKSSAINLKQLRESVAMTAPLVLKYDGLLNQVCTDDKESNMLICFGPPPSAHIDNPERTVRLAFEIHNLLNKSGFENSVAVSSGMAYCGILGNDILRQYTVIGDVVNLSAHLTGIRKNSIFCDRATYSASNKAINYAGPVMENVKGRTEPVSLYVPESILKNDSIKSNIHVSIGRKNELAVLVDAFNRTSLGKNTCIILEGDSGMGKTKLLKDFMAIASSGSAHIAAGSADFVSRNTPYAALRTIVLSLLDINHLESEKIQSEVYNDLVTRFGHRACLLNIVLNTAIPDSEEIRNLTGSQRVQATHSFLLKLLMDESWKQPLTLIIDDAQWIDESTWKLIESVKENVTHCLIVLSFQITEGIQQLQRFKDQGAETIVLKELAENDLEELVCAKLGVSSISPDVATLVSKISKGNPFFCIELAGSLVDQELLLFDNNTCSLVKDAGTKELSLPETVRGAIRRRIDRLGQGSQLSLKVGSVAGNRFAEKMVCNIYPIVNEKKLVTSYLHEVEQFGFLNAGRVDNLKGYIFNNATTIEVAYEMTLADQRRQLHRESAKWYEKNFSYNLQPFYVRLANHWEQANEKDKAAVYYEKEAIRLFQLGFVKEALDMGLEGVKLLGQDIIRDLPSIRQKIGENFAAIGILMEGKKIESLIRHKKLHDPQREKIIKMLLSLSPFAHQSQQGELFALMSIICLRLTLEHGNGESAAEVYAMYSIIYKAFTADSETAFTWSNLALEVDKKNGHTLQSRVIFIHCWFIALWKLPVEELIPLSYTGAEAGFKSGDILFACFNLSLTAILKSTCGKNLNEVIQTSTDHFIRNNRAVMNAAFHLIHEEQVAKAFQGRTTGYTSLTDEKYDEQKDVASICETDLFNQIAYYLVSKLKLNVHFGNWEEAIVWGEKSLPLLPAFANQPGHIELEQFYTMAALYRAAETDADASANFSNIANAGIEKINSWAKLCPANFLHKALMVEAIRDGFAGQTAEAEHKFVKAADQALVSGYIQDRGLAFEHLVRMKKRMGANYSKELQLAIDAYQQWGADGKIRYLREQF